MSRKKSRSAQPAHRDPRFAAYEARNLRALASQRAYNAGRRLMREGRVTHGKLRGRQLEAIFPGTGWWGSDDYRAIAVLPLPGEVFDTSVKFSCTCVEERPCQHVVALLLAWIERNETITEVPTVAEQLAGRTFDDLVAIISAMVDADPDLEAIIALPPPVPGRPANVSSLDPGLVRARVISAFQQLDDSPTLLFSADASELDQLIGLSSEYGSAGLWADAVLILRELAAQAIAAGQDGFGAEHIRDIFTECDVGLSTCFARQAELPESDRLDSGQRTGLIRTIYDLWRHDVAGPYPRGIVRYGPSAIALQATVSERVMVDRWLHAEPVTDQNLQLAIGEFEDLLHSVDNLDYDELLAQYREAELWDKVALTLLKLGRIGEAIATAKRHLTTTDKMTRFAADLAGVEDGKHLARAITVMEDHAWEINGRDADADAEAEAWLAYRYTLAGRASEALPLADKWFVDDPGLPAWRCVRDAAQLPGQPKDAWTTRRQAMEATLIADERWLDLALIRVDDLRLDDAMDAFEHLQHQVASDSFLHPPDEILAVAMAINVAREQADPDETIGVYLDTADDLVKQRNREAYQQAAIVLARVRYVLELHGRGAEWPEMIRKIREQNRTLRAFHEELAVLDL